MQFVSFGFLLFLLITVSVFYIVPKKIRYIWLLLTSWIFYYLLCDKLILLLFAVTVISYISGLFCAPSSKSIPGRKRKLPLISGIVLLVFTLGYFKYTGFLLETVKSLQNALGLESVGEIATIILPVGISFYTFQAIGYIIDCYRGTIEPEKNFLKLSLFISFFPQITSGPIERAGNMLPQYTEPSDFDHDNLRDGLLLMLWGYFQKIIIADRLAVLVNTVYSSYKNYPGTILFLATVFYSLEIYLDFAGYSNIAIGAAKTMGIEIMQNFEQPYLSQSIAEFWRRWHISLSSWLRDYLYIPLGGNRKGYVRKLINICIVFAISGLWHGAAWTFVFWGLLHGLYQVVEIITKPSRDKLVDMLKFNPQGLTIKVIRIIITFLLVNIGWIFFKAPTFKVSMYMLKNMWTITPWVFFDKSLFNLGLTEADVRLLIPALIMLIIVDILGYKGISIREKVTKQALCLRWAVYILAVLFVLVCGVWGPGYNAASFIYSSF
ncbi:MBOAT family O-acyltransferase [Butyrivibrio sp. JL13D10]|uniref:MBOAT family O-acyltransferase n=1 Tax=Butyrivibrio sp. JL13D10 TaxID=3236815 RepID=UPI0038B4304B